jgi:hypothetical protein
MSYMYVTLAASDILGGDEMEAIMIAGLAAVVVGGIYSVLDTLADLRESEKTNIPFYSISNSIVHL